MSGVKITMESARALKEVIRRVLGPVGEKAQGPNSRYDLLPLMVELTALQDPPPAEGKPAGYKASVVLLNPQTGVYEPIGYYFNPDGSDNNIAVLDYVYEMNGNIDLVGKIVPVFFRGVKDGTKGLWQFAFAESEPELGEILYEPKEGLYNITVLDANLVPTGEVLIEVPCLTGREKLKPGERVEILKKSGKYYFEWNDPRLRNAGDDGSPPPNANGSYDPFSDEGGAVNGVDKGFNDEGEYLFNRLHAIGPSESSDGSIGAAIKKVSDHNWAIEILGPDGNPFIPYIPPEVTEDEDDGCSYELQFNENSRILTLFFIDADGNRVECSRVNIPCCETEGGGGGGRDDYDSDTPSEDPDDPDSPTYEDDCPKPSVSITLDEDSCFPLAADQVIGEINVKLNGGDFKDLQMYVSNVQFNGADIATSSVGITANKKFVVWKGGAGLGEVGTYSFEVVAMFSCQSETEDVKHRFMFSIRDCSSECDEPTTESGGDGGGDPCDENNSVIEWEVGGTYPAVTANAASKNAQVSFYVEMQHGSASNNLPGKLPKFGEKTQDQRTKYTYAYSSSYSGAFTVLDSTDTVRREFDVPTVSNKYGTVKTGKLFVSYIGSTTPPTAYCRFTFNQWTWTPLGEAIGNDPATFANTADSGNKYNNSSFGDGDVSITIKLNDNNTEPPEKRWCGKLQVKNPCTDGRGYTYSLTGAGADDAKFVIIGQDVYLKGTTDSVALAGALQSIQVQATHPTSPTVTQTMNVGIVVEFQEFGVDNDIAPGKKGTPVATISPLDSGGDLVQSPTQYSIASFRDGELNDQEYFSIEASPNGDAQIMSNVDLPDGVYTLRVAGQNEALRANDNYIQQDLTIIIDSGADVYQIPTLIGVV